MLTTARAQVAVCLNLTRAISHTRTVEEIFAIALDALEEGLGVSRASILLFDPDGVMRFKAWRGLSDTYRRAVEGHSPWSPTTTDAQPVVVSDVSSEPSIALFLPTIQAEGIAAMSFVPLISRGRVIGKFMLYADTPYAPAEDELQLAGVIASQVAFAVERTRAQEQARESEERLRFALEAATMGTWDWDVRSNVLRWSDNLERVHGLEPGTFDGTFQSYEREIHPDDRERVFASIQHALATGAPHDVEYRIVAPDGAVRWVEGKGRVERAADGTPVRMTGVCMNVTPRKQAEFARIEVVEEGNQRLTALVRASAALLTCVDTQAVAATTIATARTLLVADGYAVWASDPSAPTWRMLSSTGVSARFASRVLMSSRAPATPDGLPFSSALAISDVFEHPMLRDQTEAYRDEGIRSLLVCPMRIGAERLGTLVFYYRSPHEFSHSDLETAQTLANLAAAALTTADLHDQLRAERNAAETARSRAAFLADATAILSQSLDYEETLAAVARLAVPDMADWCAVDIVAGDGQLRRVAVAHTDPAKVEYARALHERYPPDPTAPGGVHDVIRTGRPAMLESIPPALVAERARDEEHLRILTALSLTSYVCVPLVAAGATLGAITFVYAESGRHYGRPDLAFAQELAARAALALDNAFAYARVHEASRIKDEFLATLSHELRTPLNAILGYGQMLTAGMLAADRQANAMTVLMRNAQSLKQIIDDVLDVARITSGKLRLAVSPVELPEIVQNAAATVQPAADAKGVSLVVSIAERMPAVLGDPDRLQQVIWNLLSNAVKFTPRGGEVSLRLEEAAGSIEVVVRDNGQGIERAFLPHIFERFRQADSRFSREHAGLGLGLAIVRDLAELHGGSVTAHSDGPGAGATFTVRLPVIGAPVPAAAAAAPEGRVVALPPPARAPHELLRGTRVLAVDDEEDALGLLRAILENAGAEVETAGSAQDALEALRRGTYDALIADLGMPGTDGLELIRRVRQTLPSPANAIPGAALTAYARSEDRVTALASGFQMHIAKPVNPADLITAVAGLVGRSGR